ncbi:MAG: hypothetical protein ABI723_08020 [Bacteroidia bacterium]
MAKLTIETSAAYAKALLKMYKEDKKVKTAYLQEPEVEYQRKLTAADWVRPGRPATDEEVEEFFKEREKEKGIPFEEAKIRILKNLEKWKKKKQG